MPRKHRFESPALQYLYDRYIGDDPARIAGYELALVNAQVARAIYDLRTSVKLTQAALAKLVGTTPSVISRLEDADYEGHSVAILRRIAAALNHDLEIRFVPHSAAIARDRIARKKAPRRRTATRAVPPRRST